MRRGFVGGAIVGMLAAVACGSGSDATSGGPGPDGDGGVAD